jgi:hypothetical protein
MGVIEWRWEGEVGTYIAISVYHPSDHKQQ